MYVVVLFFSNKTFYLKKKKPIGNRQQRDRIQKRENLEIKVPENVGTMEGQEMVLPFNRSREQDMVMDSDVFLVWQEKDILWFLHFL